MSEKYLFTKSELDTVLRHQLHTQVQKEVDAISEEHFKAMSVAEYFRLKPDQAGGIVEQMCLVVQGWEKAAQTRSISLDEIERMRVAFGRTDSCSWGTE